MVTALALSTAAPALAFSFLDRAYGTPEVGLAPRSRAMGGTGAAMGTGAFSLINNPATLILTQGSRVQINAEGMRASENRFVPIFDTFDSFVDENAIAVNDFGYGDFQGGVVADEWGNGLRVSAGVFSRYDTRYDYQDERRTTDTSDEIVSNRFIETTGVLRTLTVGAAYDLDDNGSGVGVALNYYFGTVDDRDALVPFAATTGGSVVKMERNLDGVSLTFGATGRINDRLQIGAAIETAPQLNDDYTLWVNNEIATPDTLESGDLNLPLRFQGGATYRPRNSLATTFAADVVYTPWSDLEDHLDSKQKLEDTWEVRFGLEHVFYSGVSGRLGFRYGESYAMKEADRATFTFGFGYALNALSIDLAGEVGKRTSRQEPLRPRDEQSNAVGAGRDRVEDTMLRGVIGVSYAF